MITKLNQVVFSSINYGTDTSAEGRCVIRELLISTEQGVGNNATAIFPIQIWKTKAGVSVLPTDPNYDLYKLACKVSARRFFPNFLNLDATFNKDNAWDINDPKRYEHEVAAMGCRTRVYENAFGPKTSIGRGNISFSTMNLVKLAIEVSIQDGFLYKENNDWKFNENKNSVEDKNRRLKAFLVKLSNLVTITTKQLHQRFEFQKTAFKKQFPLLMQGLWNGSESLKDTDTIESVINQGTLGVGFIGLAETLKALTGKHHGESEESQKFGLTIIKSIKDQCIEAREKYKHNYACLATPAEGLSGKFTKIDKKEFGIIPGVTDKEYYTNSNHVPVEYKCSIEHKFKIEGPYHELTTAGHIGYCEIDGDLTKNPEAIMDIVQLGRKYNMGYISINHTQLRCPYCNYESNENLNITECPHDHHKLDILQRITGYLVGSTDRWNSGKLDELHRRINHNLYENTSNNS